MVAPIGAHLGPNGAAPDSPGQRPGKLWLAIDVQAQHVQLHLRRKLPIELVPVVIDNPGEATTSAAAGLPQLADGLLVLLPLQFIAIPFVFHEHDRAVQKLDNKVWEEIRLAVSRSGRFISPTYSNA
jgi:hypothetical protein